MALEEYKRELEIKLQHIKDCTDKVYEKLTEDEQFRKDVAITLAHLYTGYNSIGSFALLNELIATIGSTVVNPNEN